MKKYLTILEKILQSWTYVKGASTATRVLVKWSNHDASLATWENLNELKHHFPWRRLGGKPVLKKGGMSRFAPRGWMKGEGTVKVKPDPSVIERERERRWGRLEQISSMYSNH